MFDREKRSIVLGKEHATCAPLLFAIRLAESIRDARKCIIFQHY